MCSVTVLRLHEQRCQGGDVLMCAPFALEGRRHLDPQSSSLPSGRHTRVLSSGKVEVLLESLLGKTEKSTNVSVLTQLDQHYLKLTLKNRKIVGSQFPVVCKGDTSVSTLAPSSFPLLLLPSSIHLPAPPSPSFTVISTGVHLEMASFF